MREFILVLAEGCFATWVAGTLVVVFIFIICLLGFIICEVIK